MQRLSQRQEFLGQQVRIGGGQREQRPPQVDRPGGFVGERGEVIDVAPHRAVIKRGVQSERVAFWTRRTLGVAMAEQNAIVEREVAQ